MESSNNGEIEPQVSIFYNQRKPPILGMDYI